MRPKLESFFRKRKFLELKAHAVQPSNHAGVSSSGLFVGAWPIRRGKLGSILRLEVVSAS